MSARKYSSSRFLLSFLLAILLLAIFTLPQASGEDLGQIFLKNSSFKTGDDAVQPVNDWLWLDRNPGATVFAPLHGEGTLLMTASEFARGDLLSSAFPAKPFTKVKVTLKYKVELGDPLLFICIRPRLDRFNVDLNFLPRGKLGKTVTHSVVVHSCIEDIDHAIAVSITGKGMVRLLSVSAEKVGTYKGKNKSALVVDLMRTDPAEKGKEGWKNITRLKTVLGFSSIDFVHYTLLSEEIIKKLEPSLIVFSPSGGGKMVKEKVYSSIEVAVNSKIPILGICYGHQWLAGYFGCERTKTGAQWGTYRIEIAKKTSPFFQGFPRAPFFYISESHNWTVMSTPKDSELIATSKESERQAFYYPKQKYFTTQFHFERGWEDNCPEGNILMKNVLREFDLLGK